MATVTLTGDKEIRKALKELPDRTRVRVLVKANGVIMRKALRIAKKLVPVKHGLLKASLGVKTFKDGKSKHGGGAVATAIGPRKGFRAVLKTNAGVTRKSRKGREKVADPRKYAHLVEFGTQRTAARPFLRPALQAIEGDIDGEYAALVFAGIEAEWDKIKALG